MKIGGDSSRTAKQLYEQADTTSRHLRNHPQSIVTFMRNRQIALSNRVLANNLGKLEERENPFSSKGRNGTGSSSHRALVTTKTPQHAHSLFKRNSTILNYQKALHNS